MAKAGSNDRGLFEREKGSGVWWIRYADHQGKERREQCGAKSHARKVYDDRKREVRLRRQSPELFAAEDRVTFRQIADDALAYCRRHVDYEKDAARLERMCEWWAQTPAASITAQMIEARFAAMTIRSFRGKNAAAAAQVVSGATFNRYRALLSLTFRLAQKNGRVPQGFNPARSVELRRELPRVRWLSADEEQRLRAVMVREYPERIPVLDLALNCGLRWSDQRSLSTESRDGNALRVVIGKTQVPLGIGLNSLAGQAFDELAERAGGDGRLIGEKSPRGWFASALIKAGIKDFHWHDLRHTFATRLLLAGVPAQQVQRLMGHKSITMTLRYAHVVAGFEGDALAKLAEMNQHCAKGGAPVVSIEKRRKRGA